MGGSKHDPAPHQICVEVRIRISLHFARGSRLPHLAFKMSGRGRNGGGGGGGGGRPVARNTRQGGGGGGGRKVTMFSPKNNAGNNGSGNGAGPKKPTTLDARFTAGSNAPPPPFACPAPHPAPCRHSRGSLLYTPTWYLENAQFIMENELPGIWCCRPCCAMMQNKKATGRTNAVQASTTARYAATMAKRTGQDKKKFAVRPTLILYFRCDKLTT